MSPLIVFLIKDLEHLEKYNKLSEDKLYHRCFVFANVDFKKHISFKKTDSIFVFEYLKYDFEILIKMILSCTNPIYSHYIIINNLNAYIDNIIETVKEQDYYSGDDTIAFSKRYFIFNKINFSYKTEYDFNLLDISKIMEKAFNFDELENPEFNLVLKEILPECTYNYDENIEISNDIFSILENKNKSSSTVYFVTNDINKYDKKTIIFTKEKDLISNVKIKRTDGLIMYLT